MLRRRFDLGFRAEACVGIQRRGAAALLGVTLGVPALSAAEIEAPFGFSWGPVKTLPRPSSALRDGNVTVLVYRGDRLPVDARDTDEVSVEVCAKEGLQEVIWISRRLSDDEARERYRAIKAEGSRRYGRSEADATRGTVSWRGGRIMAAVKPSGGPGRYRILMVSYGPEFDACSDELDHATGHSAGEYWAQLLARPDVDGPKPAGAMPSWRCAR